MVFVLRVLFFLLLSISANAQTLPLDSVISAIEKNNPQLQGYNYTIQAYDAYAKGAKSWMPPRAGAGLFQTNYNLRQGMMMLSVEQMIPNPRKQQLKEDYLLSRSGAVKENLSFNRNRLIAEAKRQYYEASIIRRKQNVLQESEALLKFLLEVSELRYTFQQEKLDNIYKAQANLYKLQSEQVMLENELRQRKIALNTLMNRDKTFDFAIDLSPFEGGKGDVFRASSFIITVPDTSAIDTIRSDIRAINQSIRSMELNQKLEQGNRLPDFGIRLDHMQGFGMMPNQFSIMGMFTIPIVPWASREYKANVEGMRLEILAMEKEKEAMRNEITGELRSLNTEVENKKQQAGLFHDKIIPALEKSYEAARIAYEQNTGDLFKVLDAWETLQMSKMQHLDLLQELLNLRVDYEKAIEQK